MVGAPENQKKIYTIKGLFEKHRQLLVYLFVGVINTIITAAIIYLLLHYNFTYYNSNILGYLVGIIVSFLLNSHLTFKQKPNINRAIKFIIVVAISYFLNLLVITFTAKIMPNHLFIAQLFGMPVYTLTGFFLNKYWVFNKNNREVSR